MKRILIAGVAGMIGSHLLDAVLKAKRFEVIGIDNFCFGRIEKYEPNDIC